MKNIRYVFIAVLAVALMGLPAIPGVMAQRNSGELNLTTSPLPLSLKAKPGSSVSTDLRIQNSGSETEHLKIDLLKFSAHGEEGKPELKEREPGDDYFDWVDFSESEFSVEPKQWKTIKMNIRLPEDAAFGYYYAVTFSRADKTRANGELASGVEGGTATLVLLEAEVPNAKRELKVESFSSDKRSYEFLPAKFEIRLHNSGNVHSVPNGTVFISKGDKQIGTVSVNKAGGNVLPDSNRIFQTEWQDGFPVYKTKTENGKVVSKDGQDVRELSWNLGEMNKLRFGKYTATLVMAYDDGTRDVPLEATLTFWVIPWRIIVGGLVVVVFASIGVWVSVRKGFIKFRGKPIRFRNKQ